MHRLLQSGRAGGHCGSHIPQQSRRLQCCSSTKGCIALLPVQHVAEHAATGTPAQASNGSDAEEVYALKRKAPGAWTASRVLPRHALNNQRQHQARSLSTLPPEPPQDDDMSQVEELLGLPSQPPPQSEPQHWWERDDAFRPALVTTEHKQWTRKRASSGGEGGERAAPQQQQQDHPPATYGSWDVPLARDILTAGGAQQAPLLAGPAPGGPAGLRSRAGQPLEAGAQASAMQALVGSRGQHQALHMGVQKGGQTQSEEELEAAKAALTQTKMSPPDPPPRTDGPVPMLTAQETAVLRELLEPRQASQPSAEAPPELLLTPEEVAMLQGIFEDRPLRLRAAEPEPEPRLTTDLAERVNQALAAQTAPLQHVITPTAAQTPTPEEVEYLRSIMAGVDARPRVFMDTPEAPADPEVATAASQADPASLQRAQEALQQNRQQILFSYPEAVTSLADTGAAVSAAETAAQVDDDTRRRLQGIMQAQSQVPSLGPQQRASLPDDPTLTADEAGRLQDVLASLATRMQWTSELEPARTPSAGTEAAPETASPEQARQVQAILTGPTGVLQALKRTPPAARLLTVEEVQTVRDILTCLRIRGQDLQSSPAAATPPTADELHQLRVILIQPKATPQPSERASPPARQLTTAELERAKSILSQAAPAQVPPPLPQADPRLSAEEAPRVQDILTRPLSGPQAVPPASHAEPQLTAEEVGRIQDILTRKRADLQALPPAPHVDLHPPAEVGLAKDVLTRRTVAPQAPASAHVVVPRLSPEEVQRVRGILTRQAAASQAMPPPPPVERQLSRDQVLLVQDVLTRHAAKPQAPPPAPAQPQLTVEQAQQSLDILTRPGAPTQAPPPATVQPQLTGEQAQQARDILTRTTPTPQAPPLDHVQPKLTEEQAQEVQAILARTAAMPQAPPPDHVQPKLTEEQAQEVQAILARTAATPQASAPAPLEEPRPTEEQGQMVKDILTRPAAALQAPPPPPPTPPVLPQLTPEQVQQAWDILTRHENMMRQALVETPGPGQPASQPPLDPATRQVVLQALEAKLQVRFLDLSSGDSSQAELPGSRAQLSDQDRERLLAVVRAQPQYHLQVADVPLGCGLKTQELKRMPDDVKLQVAEAVPPTAVLSTAAPAAPEKPAPRLLQSAWGALVSLRHKFFPDAQDSQAPKQEDRPRLAPEVLAEVQRAMATKPLAQTPALGAAQQGEVEEAARLRTELRLNAQQALQRQIREHAEGQQALRPLWAEQAGAEEVLRPLEEDRRAIQQALGLLGGEPTEGQRALRSGGTGQAEALEALPPRAGEHAEVQEALRPQEGQQPQIKQVQETRKAKRAAKRAALETESLKRIQSEELAQEARTLMTLRKASRTPWIEYEPPWKRRFNQEIQTPPEPPIPFQATLGGYQEPVTRRLRGESTAAQVTHDPRQSPGMPPLPVKMDPNKARRVQELLQKQRPRPVHGKPAWGERAPDPYRYQDGGPSSHHGGATSRWLMDSPPRQLNLWLALSPGSTAAAAYAIQSRNCSSVAGGKPVSSAHLGEQRRVASSESQRDDRAPERRETDRRRRPQETGEFTKLKDKGAVTGLWEKPRQLPSFLAAGPLLETVQQKAEAFRLAEEAKQVRDEVQEVRDPHEVAREARLEQLKELFAKRNKERMEQKAKEVTIDLRPEPILVSKLAEVMQQNVQDVVAKLQEIGGEAYTELSSVDVDTAELVALELGIKVNMLPRREWDVGRTKAEAVEVQGKLLPVRPPIVAVMGHVDHGKTTLLDALRKTNVAEKEVAGITQKLGAFQVKADKKGPPLTFFDTPGHAAFTAMRQSSSRLTDVVVLVVAADDGIRAQTVEVLGLLQKNASLQAVVAVTKIDKDPHKVDENVQKIEDQLLAHGLVTERHGGDTPVVPISAVKGMNLDKLLEAVKLQGELMELRADQKGRGEGMVINATNEAGTGIVVNVLVSWGKIKENTWVVAGEQYGKIKRVSDQDDRRIKTGNVCQPVRLLGLKGLPMVGDEVITVESEQRARLIAEVRKKRAEAEKAATAFDEHLDRDMEADMAQLLEFRDTKFRKKRRRGFAPRKEEDTSGPRAVPVIFKADGYGELAAMADVLKPLPTDEVFVDIIHQGVGNVTESDVQMAAAANCNIFAFNVTVDGSATAAIRSLAKENEVDIISHNVIYRFFEDLRELLEEALPEQFEDVMVGRANVEKVYKARGKAKSVVAGVVVSEGQLLSAERYRVLRDGEVVHTADKADSMQHNKDSVQELKKGQPGGIGLPGFNDFKEGDILECYRVNQVKKTLDISTSEFATVLENKETQK